MQSLVLELTVQFGLHLQRAAVSSFLNISLSPLSLYPSSPRPLSAVRVEVHKGGP